MADEQTTQQTSMPMPEIRFDTPNSVTALEQISSFTPEEMQDFQDSLSPENLQSFQQSREFFGLGQPETFEQGQLQTTPTPALETFTSTDLEPVEFKQEPVVVADDIFASDRPPLIDRDTLREVGRYTTDTAIAASRKGAVDDAGTRKERRVLSEREGFSDHYNYSVKRDSNGDVLITTQTTGSVSKGKVIGKTEPKEIRLTAAHALNISAQAAQYASNYNQMSPMQQAIGGIQLVTNASRPWFQVRREEDGTIIQGIPEVGVIAGVVDSLSLYNQWGNLGNLDKFLGTANGMVRIASDLGYRNKIPAQALNGLALANFGYATYNLLNNWNEMNEAERAIGTLHAINQGAQAYTAGSAVLASMKGTAVAGSATAGTAVAGSATAGTAASATAAGTGTAAASASAGAGASQAAIGVGAAENTTAAGGGAVAAEGGFGAAALTWAGYAAAAYGAYSMVDQWGRGGNAQSRATQGSNGAAIGAVFGPYGALIGAAIGVAVGSINAGKSMPQMRRDALRKGFVKNNIFQQGEGSQVVVGLSDGSTYDVGIDGSDGRAMLPDGTVKTFANPDRIAERDKEHVLDGNELRPYDIDYTNDLDYITSLATKAANLLPVGGTLARETSEVDQINGYLTNAATSNVGREMTEENFDQVMENVRGFYSNMGIDNADEGMEILNDMKKQNRLSDDDYNAMVMGMDFAFNSDFERAQQLLGELGRDEPPANVTMEELKEQESADRDELEAAQNAAEEAERQKQSEAEMETA